jgi:hypothetical protein
MSDIPALPYGSRSPDGRWWWDGQAWQPVPEAQQAAERAGQPTAAWNRPVPAGPLGHQRSVGVSILLAVVTLGIYTYVWTYRTQGEIKRHSDIGVGAGLGLLIYFLVGVATYFLVASDTEAMYQARGWNSPVRTITGLWFLLPLIGSIIWFVKVQGALNEYWKALGVPPP